MPTANAHLSSARGPAEPKRARRAPLRRLWRAAAALSKSLSSLSALSLPAAALPTAPAARETAVAELRLRLQDERHGLDERLDLSKYFARGDYLRVGGQAFSVCVESDLVAHNVTGGGKQSLSYPTEALKTDSTVDTYYYCLLYTSDAADE